MNMKSEKVRDCKLDVYEFNKLVDHDINEAKKIYRQNEITNEVKLKYSLAVNKKMLIERISDDQFFVHNDMMYKSIDKGILISPDRYESDIRCGSLDIEVLLELAKPIYLSSSKKAVSNTYRRYGTDYLNLIKVI